MANQYTLAAAQGFPGSSGPALGAATITPSDATILNPPCRALYVGVTGNVAVRMIDGTLPILVAVPAGALLPICCDKVLATGTTATTMIGLY